MTTGESSVEVVREREIPDRPVKGPLRLAVASGNSGPNSPPAPTPTTSMARPSRKDSILLAVFQAIAKVLAIRVLLLLSLTGAFTIAMEAMDKQSWTGLAILATYCLLTLIPLVWLEVGKGRNPLE